MASTPNKRPGLSLIQDEFWYAGALSERKAEQVLTKRGEKGAFLVRDSLLPEADYVLSVKGREDVDHYQITVAPDDECCLNGYTFTNISDAIEFYTENRIGKVFLDPPEEPVVPQTAVPRAIGPKIKAVPTSTAHQPSFSPQTTANVPAAPTSTAHQPSLSPQTTANVPAAPVPNTVQATEAYTSASASLQNALPNIEPTMNNEAQKPKPATTESSEPTAQNEISQNANTRIVETENQTLAADSTQIVQMTKTFEQVPQAKLFKSNPSPDEELTLNAQENTDVQHTEPIKDPPNLPRENSERKPPDDEEATKTMALAKESEPINVTGSKQCTNDEEDSSLTPQNTEKLQHKEISDDTNSQLEPLKSPKNTKVEQRNELRRLPSIGDKKKALEARLRGEDENTEKKRKVPPPVPKRVSTATDLFQIQSSKAKVNELNSDSGEVIQSNMKETPLPAPKKLSIPLNFQQNNEEDSGKIEQKATSPPEVPKRLVIPESLKFQPPPPPLSTHPGLAKKEEERQELLQQQQQQQQQQELLQQQQQVEAEKPQPQKVKKRSSFFRNKKKDKDSDKEKATTVKRTPSLKANEPVTLPEAERQEQEQEEAAVNASPPPRPKKVIGVPTLAMSTQLDVSGGELESVFKTITKHEWRPEDDESIQEVVVVSTFGQHSKTIEESIEPETSSEPQKIVAQKQKPIQKVHTHQKKESIGDITGVHTFHPKGFSTPPEMKETHFTFTTPINTDIYLNTDFLKYTSQDTPPRSPNSILNSSSTSSLGVIAQSPTGPSSTPPSTPQTPTFPTDPHPIPAPRANKSPSLPRANKPLISPRANKAPPSYPTPTPTINVSPSNSDPQQQNRDIAQPPQTSEATGSALPTGFVVTSAGNPTPAARNPFSRQQQSLVAVVPGIPTKVATLPRGKSLDALGENVDSPAAGIRIRHSRTESGKDKQSSVPPMNSKRSIIKKRNSIFKKK